MDYSVSDDMKYGIAAYLVIAFTLLYVFCYQFNYPFSSTIFLYAAFGFMLLYIVLTRNIEVSRQTYMFILLVVVSWIGIVYTDNIEKGQREAILLLVMLLFLITLSQDNVMVWKMRKAIYVCSFIVLVGVLVQYIQPNAFNSLMRFVLRSDCYEQLMWSFNVDGAYAGFSAYTADAAYFCAVVFGNSIIDLLKDIENISKKRKILSAIVTFASIFAVILTSKRGVIIAMVAAIILAVLICGKSSPKTILAFGFLVVTGIIFIYYLSGTNSVVGLFLQRFDVSDGRDITTGRIDIWKDALNAFQGASSLIGKGTGAAYTIESAGLHNIYLQIFYDHGIIGFIAYAMLFIYNLRIAVVLKDAKSLFIQFVMLIYGISGNPIYSNSFFIAYIVFTVLSYASLPEQISEVEVMT